MMWLLVGFIFSGLGGMAVCYERYRISIRIPIVILSVWVSALVLVVVGYIQGDLIVALIILWLTPFTFTIALAEEKHLNDTLNHAHWL